MPSPPKKYVCSFCSRAFSRSEHKQRHERSHTNEKPFQCHYCKSAFVRRDLLQRHCRTVHNMRLISRTHTKEEKESTASHPEFIINRAPNFTSTGFGSSMSLNSYPSTSSSGTPQSPQPFPKLDHPSNSLPFQDKQVVASARALLQLGPSKTELMNGTGPESDRPKLASPLQTTFAMNGSTNHTKPCRQSGPFPNDVQTRQDSKDISAGQDLSAANYFPLQKNGLSSHYLVQLLSISNNARQIYDDDDRQHSVDDMFLIGFINLIGEPDVVCTETRTGIAEFLMTTFLSDQDFTELKPPLVYIILAVGSLKVSQSDQNINSPVLYFIEKAWKFLNNSKISRGSLLHQCERLKITYLLSYVYTKYLGSLVIISHLENDTKAFFQDLSNVEDETSTRLVKSNIDLLWSIFILLSKSRSISNPPTFFAWYSSKPFIGSEGMCLSTYMNRLSSAAIKPGNSFAVEVVVCTLANEVSNFNCNKPSNIYSSRKLLSRAISEMIGYISQTSSCSNSQLTEVFKKRIVVNAPAKFKDLLEQSIFETSSPIILRLLHTSLQDLNSQFCFGSFMERHLNSSFSELCSALLTNFCSHDDHYIKFDANFGNISMPLLFNRKVPSLLDSSSKNRNSMSTAEKDQINCFILHWLLLFVLSLIKLISSRSSLCSESTIAKSNILQCILYLLRGKTESSYLELANDLPSIFNELKQVSESWLMSTCLSPQFMAFKSKLHRFLNDVVTLVSTKKNFAIENLYMVGDSLQLAKERSKSTSCLDPGFSLAKGMSTIAPPHQSSPFINSPGMSQTNSTGAAGATDSPILGAKNYILMGRSNDEQIHAYSSLATSPGTRTSLPSIRTATSAVQVPAPLTNGVSYQSSPPPILSTSTILPPIHSSLRRNGHDSYGTTK